MDTIKYTEIKAESTRIEIHGDNADVIDVARVEVRKVEIVAAAQAEAIAMKEAEMDDGYSERGSYRDGGSYRYNRGMRGYSRDGGSYDDGSYDSRSYARGRGRYANRDSMGRYSNDGYSQDGDMMDDLHELMDKAPDDRTRQEFKNFIDKMKQMN